MSSSVWARRGLWLLIGLLVLVAWAGGLDGPFVYDDKVEVIGNPTIRMLEEWRAIVAYNVSRPLLISTYAVDLSNHGFEPRGYHVTSLVIHVLAVGAALFLGESVARRCAHPRPLVVAGAAAALWAVHPMVTESVSYITGRSESLCGLFVFLSLGCWIRATGVEARGEAGWAWRLLALLAFAGAITSKEVGAMLPVAFLWSELVLGPPGSVAERLRRPRWRWYLPLVLLVVLAAWLRLQHAGTLLHSEVDRPLAVQLTTMSQVWLRYLGLWLLPLGQTLFHHQPDLAPGTLEGALSIGGWVAMLAAGAAWGLRVPGAGWALGCAALFLVPSSSFVSLKENMAEHRAYQQGLYLLLAVGLSLRGRALRLTPAVSLALLLPLLLATRARNEVWSSEVALWEEATERSPRSAEAWYGLGDALRFAGQLEGAEEAYERSVELDEANLEAWNNLGLARAERGDAEGATEAWKEALERRPSYCKAHNNLGSLAFRKRQWDAAIVEFRTTLAYCPESVVAHYHLGRIYDEFRHDRVRAVRHYEAVVALNPTFARIELVRERLLALTF